MPIAKEQLKKAIARDKAAEMRKAGLNTTNLVQAAVAAAATQGGVAP